METMRNKLSFFILTIALIFYPISLYAEKITISAVGDIMAHIELQESALYGTDNYDLLFQDVKNIFLQDDFTIANLETPLSDELRISGYPRFSAKTKLATSIKNAGIDFVSTANNHSFDQYAFGVRSTYEALKENKLAFNGIGENKRESESFSIIEVNSISLGILSLTFSLNGLRTTRDDRFSPYINYFPPYDEAGLQEVCEKIRIIKPKVDLVLILYHGGSEYSAEPTQIQTKWIKSFLEAGADVVLGSHPHVIQKMEFYKDPKEKKNKLLIYSLGNLVSAQARYKFVANPLENINHTNIRTSEGIILQFDVIKWNGKVEIVHPRFIPLFTLTYYKNITPEKYLYYYQLMPMEKILQLPDFDNTFKNLKPVKEILVLRKEILKTLLGIEEAPLLP